MRKVVKVGIISRENYRERTIAIAQGDYSPKKGEPKIWFESLRSMAQILGSKNQALLKIIIEKKPRSLSELEQISGRKKANLSRTLKTLERCGVITLNRDKNRMVPTVRATDFKVEFGLHSNRYRATG